MIYLYIFCCGLVTLFEARRVAKLDSYTIMQLIATILKIVFAPFWLFVKLIEWVIMTDILDRRIF